MSTINEFHNVTRLIEVISIRCYASLISQKKPGDTPAALATEAYDLAIAMVEEMRLRRQSP